MCIRDRYKDKDFKTLTEEERTDVNLSSKLSILLSAEFNTVFHYRFRLLEANLINSLEEELHFLGLFATHNKKSSVLWHYRKKVVTQLIERGAKSPQEIYKSEVQVLKKAHAKYPRGYYIWIYRQNLVGLLSQHFEDVFQVEREALSEFCEVNVHNYSAFSHKLWLINQLSSIQPSRADALFNEEHAWITNLLQTYTQLYKGDDRPEMTRLESLNKYETLLKKHQSNRTGKSTSA
eukprot:TRINITY_DN8054_c0_g1_i1.p1 TRINITY_DN8054_c0_g1~~TRINITY_DN8054_c0_g1_i1.p1  ORF type:complete len:255 (-),score=56.03 TRINITY_DN8054_c0_g1_i1:86-790(-)